MTPRSVTRVSESVNGMSEQFQADWDIDKLASTLDGVALLDKTIIIRDIDTDIIGLQVETHSTDTGREFYRPLS